jgi:integrase/recombinase XerD
MNRSPSNLLISLCIDGFVKYKTAEGLRPRTVDSYEWVLNKWIEKMGDKPINKVTSTNIRDYLAYLRTDYVPHTFAKNNSSGEPSTHKLSPKTLRNHWITFKAFFGWAATEFKITNPMADIPGPKYKTAPVAAFTQEDITALVKACAYARETNPGNRHSFVTRRPTAKRDEALILFLLDTGLRASELCHLKIGEVDMKTGKVVVKHGDEGGAKGGKGRTVFIGKSTRRVVWRYLIDREDRDDQDAPIFLNRGNHPFNANSLRHLIVRLAEKAGVKEAHPHKFRHTFAITYLRSGGDVFTLQALLGHSSLDMVRHYAQIAEMDVERAHRKASPVDNMRL